MIERLNSFVWVFNFMENLEVWKDILDYEGIYQVSNFGDVKSLSRKVKSIYGYRTMSERILLANKSQKYPCVVLAKEGKNKSFSIHRLVAKAFIYNPENKKCVNHINGVKTDNKVANLEWCTYSENELHSYKFLGKIANNKRLQKKDIDYIRENYIKGNLGNSGLLKIKFNISYTTINDIINCKYPYNLNN